jgi:hypothetical protein
VWPGAGKTPSGGGACTARTKSRSVRVRRGVKTLVRTRLTKAGHGVRGKTVRLRGPGFNRRRKTGAGGRVSFEVNARRAGLAKASTSFCGGKLRVAATRVRRHADADPSFTG